MSVESKGVAATPTGVQVDRARLVVSEFRARLAQVRPVAAERSPEQRRSLAGASDEAFQLLQGWLD